MNIHSRVWRKHKRSRSTRSPENKHNINAATGYNVLVGYLGEVTPHATTLVARQPATFDGPPTAVTRLYGFWFSHGVKTLLLHGNLRVLSVFHRLSGVESAAECTPREPFSRNPTTVVTTSQIQRRDARLFDRRFP